MKNAAKNVTGKGYSRYFFTIVVIAAILLFIAQAQAAPSAARLHHYSLSPQTLTFTVTSTGCTRVQDFDLSVERDSSDHNAALRITVVRTKPDWCKGMPQRVTFTKALPSGHASPAASVIITNTVTLAPGKAAGKVLKKGL
ncbi:MAG: hypothetical protein GXP17_09990 [Gammaproteobacteria bacterium]|nr:hypothetical protein [Gammaproteobacteria bacterium]